jgi:NNP family nitrate/nitrite transporter-like MFS transporter
MAASPTIAHWNPEDAGFWNGDGHRVAARNLGLSVVALTLSFAVWMLWSIVVVHLPAAGFRFTTNQLFWLAALPALSGATLRVFYAFAVPAFGGRRWTALSTASLVLPAVGLGVAVQDPQTPYEVMVALALLAGMGGGNFASSMAHVSFLYPKACVGWALGLNAGLGNLGVPLALFVVPLAVGGAMFGPFAGSPQGVPGGAPMWLQNAGYVWVPLLLASALAAWFGMNDIADAKSGFGEQAVVFRRRDNWRLSWLYLGTFGSFIGFAAALPLLLDQQVGAVDLGAAAWLGPLVGALLRPLGGWLADRHGGARVTLAAFAVMALALPLLGAGLEATGPTVQGAMLSLAALLLFAGAGIGSSSVFRMIPLVYAAIHPAPGDAPSAARAEATHRAGTEAAATLGFASAVGAYGGFFIPKSFGTALQWTGSPLPALALFGLFYLTCLAITWRHYARPGAALPC